MRVGVLAGHLTEPLVGISQNGPGTQGTEKTEPTNPVASAHGEKSLHLEALEGSLWGQ